MARKAALVTGASSGLGAEFLKLYAADKYDLVLVARSEGKLKELAAGLAKEHGVEAHVLACDLSEGGAPKEVFDGAAKLGVEVHALVNNAGFGDFGPFVETRFDRELEMMQLNMIALVHLTKLFLPGMVARGTGEVLNVASTAAFQPGPLMAIYYATKAFVLSFSEALAEEVAGGGVRVSALCPGPTETGFVKAAGMEKSKLFERGGVMDAPTVAAIGYRGVKRGCRVVVPGIRNKVMAQSVRFAPRRMITSIVKRMQDRKSL